MKALIYGAGNVGRGFIGQLLGQAGYRLTFVDINQALVHALNREGAYSVRLLDAGGGSRDIVVSGVSALDGADLDAVAKAIADCDIMATALGANILPRMAPVIAEGFSLRMKQGQMPLNIILCENLHDASGVMRRAIDSALPEADRPLADSLLGLVEASIGRMIPVQTDAMRDGDPLRICAEAYAFLPVDGAAFRGSPPAVEGLIPHTPFEYYMQRKLYIHNMGHMVCALLGSYTGKTYIYEAIADSAIELVTRQAMLESACALSVAYGVPIKPLLDHIDDLILRFGNAQLMDTCARVSQDIPRKLKPEDRLIGAVRLCDSQGVIPAYIALGAAAALRQYVKSQGLPDDAASAQQTLAELSGLDESDNRLACLISEQYAYFMDEADVSVLLRCAQQLKSRLTGLVA